MTNAQISELKSEGRYFEAGVLARQSGEACYYGCHFGMRSTRENAIAEFTAGYHAEDTVRVWPRGYAHEEGTSNFKVPAGTDESTIRHEANRLFGALAAISEINRASAPKQSVSDKDAAYYRQHDNS